MEKKRILVLCTGNSCRSQMAEGYLRLFAGDRAEVHSAGVEAHGLNQLLTINGGDFKRFATITCISPESVANAA